MYSPGEGTSAVKSKNKSCRPFGSQLGGDGPQSLRTDEGGDCVIVFAERNCQGASYKYDEGTSDDEKFDLARRIKPKRKSYKRCS